MSAPTKIRFYLILRSKELGPHEIEIVFVKHKLPLDEVKELARHDSPESSIVYHFLGNMCTTVYDGFGLSTQNRWKRWIIKGDPREILIEERRSRDLRPMNYNKRCNNRLAKIVEDELADFHLLIKK
jgi:hypothetical protein